MKIIECPRDAMQGIKEFIPTEKKIEYINSLLKVGFDTIDFGSFVSPKAVPQMKDTAYVLDELDLYNTSSKLLAIIANKRGAEIACQFEQIDFLGYPFSISEEFQKRNTNSTIEESFENVKEIQELCTDHRKELVIYISMAFGNPYGEKWDAEIAANWIEKLQQLDIGIFALADTIGVSNPENIDYMFKNLYNDYPMLEIGAHLHSNPKNAKEKIIAAYNAGCRRFDSAVRGFGGCPMAEDELVGNIATEDLIEILEDKEELYLDEDALEKSVKKSFEVFK